MSYPAHTGMIINLARFSRNELGTGYLAFKYQTDEKPNEVFTYILYPSCIVILQSTY